MGVSVLRVINDDTVAPGAGFPPHSHRDMEIISYVREGTIEHKDSMGNIERLPAGEFQLMSAGTGVTHSEYNASDAQPLKFLQIWIQPNVVGIEPGYQQNRFAWESGLQLIISPDGRSDSLAIHQNTFLYQAILAAGEEVSNQLADNRIAYLHVVSGELALNGTPLSEGDGATVKGSPVNLTGLANAEALLFDLPPMQRHRR